MRELFAALLILIIFCFIFFPEDFGKHIAQVHQGYIAEMEKGDFR